MNVQLFQAVDEWLAIDPDDETKAELTSLRERAAAGEAPSLTELQDRFAKTLEFGTAGLRGELGAGPNRMNRVVVARAAHAIGRFLLANQERFWAGRQRPLVVIGYDGRINSDVFARDSAELLAGLGLEVLLFADYAPTPVVAFTGRRLAAAASIMVTASHNPPRDNGYKVYLGGENGGSQLISPDDKAIATLIAATPLSRLPIMERSNQFGKLGYEAIAEYVDRAVELIPVKGPGRDQLKIGHTSLHGVGWETVSAIFERVGFSDTHPVVEQMRPDGRFPTVAFPNPEESGAMDLAFAAAERISADIVLANDPDADRLAVGLKVDDRWQLLTGDQVGLIFGWLLASQSVKGTMANSIVSSARLGKIATHFGLRYQQTLTGFKWISKVPGLSFGYEEALGYCVDPQHTPDKDGITAALLIAELASELKLAGKTLLDYLHQIDEAVGAEANGQISIRVSELSQISNLMGRIRANPPTELLGQEVYFEDLLAGVSLPPTDGVVLTTAGGIRVTVRPSGTEPKLKCYLSVTAASAEDAEARLQLLRAAMQQLLN